MGWDKQNRGEGSERSFEEFIQDFFDRPGMFLLVVLAVAAGTAVFTSYYIVRAQEKAVVTRFGAFLATTDEGLHFKLPFGIDKVSLVPTKIQEESFGFSSATASPNTLRRRSNNPFVSSSSKISSRKFENESLMLTGDLNVADVEWVVQYRVTNPKDFLFNVADPVKNIRDLTQTTMRKVVGDRSINDILTTGRGEIQTAVQNDMQAVIDETYQMGIIIEEVILQDVAPPEPVQPSFNQVNSALQEQKQEINKAFEAQNRIIPEAKGKAIREISQARGYREAVVNRAVGDAARFEQVLQEYAKAPEVTRKRLYLELVEQVMGTVQNFTVIDPSVRGVLPIFSGAESSTSRSSAFSGRVGAEKASISSAAIAAELSPSESEMNNGRN